MPVRFASTRPATCELSSKLSLTQGEQHNSRYNHSLEHNASIYVGFEGDEDIDARSWQSHCMLAVTDDEGMDVHLD